MNKFIAYWPLDSATPHDKYGGGYSGSTALTTFGPGAQQGMCWYFSGGTTEYLHIGPTLPLPEQFTISLWLKWTDLLATGASRVHHIIGKRDGSNGWADGSWQLAYLDNLHATYPDTLEFRTINNSSTETIRVSNVINAVTDKWFHLAVVADIRATTSRFYVNGVEVGTAVDQAITGTWSTNTSNARIGYSANLTSSVQGYMQNVGILNDMMTSALIRNYYLSAVSKKNYKNPIVWNNNPETFNTATMDYFYAFTDSLTYEANYNRVLTTEVFSGLYDTIAHQRILGSANALNDSFGTFDDTVTTDKTHDDISSETLVLTESPLAVDLNISAVLPETLALTDSLATNINATQVLSESLVGLVDTVEGRLQVNLPSEAIVLAIDVRKAWLATFPLTMAITARTFFVKNFYGSLLRIENDIAESVWLGRPGNLLKGIPVSVNINELNTFYVTKRIFNSIHPPVGTTNVSIEYIVLLDGENVTDKVASCTISYSMDSYVGDLDITWADYSLYDRIDCTNIGTSSFMVERIQVYTRVASDDNPVWVSQGKFFLEKRGTTVAYDSIVPTSWGRTRAAVLSMPYSLPLTKVWEDDTSAKAIAQELCDNAPLPVTLSWEIMDFPVLGSNMDVEGTDAIDVISQLAGAVGGILTCNRNGDLKVIYKYAVQ